jgi:thiamine kinase-like enzyme
MSQQQVTKNRQSFLNYYFDGAFDDGLRERAITFLDHHLAGVVDVDNDSRTVWVERLAGGACNINLRVSVGTQRWALRLVDPESARWGVDRTAAVQAQQDAAAIGIAPGVTAATASGDCLSEFAEGAQLTAEMLQDDAMLKRVADTLSSLNAGTTVSREFSPFVDARTFVEYADGDGADSPPLLNEMLARLFRIEALFVTVGAPRAFCHSDSVPQNYLVSDEQVMMVDFDYAGIGWTAFELGSLCCQAELGDERTSTLLRFYDPEHDEGQRARVELMRFVAGVREACWALMAEPILSQRTTPLEGWTYRGYAEQNLRQAHGVVDGGDFDRYMIAARVVRSGARC